MCNVWIVSWDMLLLLPTAHSYISLKHRGKSEGERQICQCHRGTDTVWKATMKQENINQTEKSVNVTRTCVRVWILTQTLTLFICHSVSALEWLIRISFLNYSTCTMDFPGPEMKFELIRLKWVKMSESWPALFSGVDEIKDGSKMDHPIPTLLEHKTMNHTLIFMRNGIGLQKAHDREQWFRGKSKQKEKKCTAAKTEV